jgi:hypothetical protein
LSVADEERSASQDYRSQQGSSEKIYARHESLLVIIHRDASNFVSPFDRHTRLGPTPVGPPGQPQRHGGHEQKQSEYPKGPFAHYKRGIVAQLNAKCKIASAAAVQLPRAASSSPDRGPSRSAAASTALVLSDGSGTFACSQVLRTEPARGPNRSFMQPWTMTSYAPTRRRGAGRHERAPSDPQGCSDR